ncbi:conserved hypothetical protein [Clostridium botulinum C str. Eklund]|nr:conserved hypothetical protein [Clostridium botulinum C str. Eklund]
MGIKIYLIKKEYINYLRQFDKNVDFNQKMNGNIRKYIGIVVHTHGFNYFAPMSSPKEKHKKINDNQIDCVKIHNGELGVINLNNMIPVDNNELMLFDINNQEEKYKNLLFNQLRYINRNKKNIKRKAEVLYSIVNSKTKPHINKRCCNFKLLEKKCIEYTYTKQSFSEVAIGIRKGEENN